MEFDRNLNSEYFDILMWARIEWLKENKTLGFGNVYYQERNGSILDESNNMRSWVEKRRFAEDADRVIRQGVPGHMFVIFHISQ